MFGIILVGHGKMASAFRSCVNHIVGNVEQLEAMDIFPEDNMDQRREQILATVTELDEGQGVIILTDMFGGTPSNLALSTLGHTTKVEVITGMNLPMLIKLMEVRKKMSFDEAVLAAQEAGRKYIHVAGHFLNNNTVVTHQAA